MTEHNNKTIETGLTDRVAEFLRRELPLILCFFGCFALSAINGPIWGLFPNEKSKTNKVEIASEQPTDNIREKEVSSAEKVFVTLCLFCFILLAVLLFTRRDLFSFVCVTRENPQWGFLLVLKLCVYCIFLFQIGLLVTPLLFDIGQMSKTMRINLISIIQSLAELLTLLWGLLILRKMSSGAMRAAGVVSYRWRQNVLAGIFLYLAFLPVLSTIGMFFTQEHQALQNYTEEKSLLMTIILFICIAVIIPVAEEFFFRGIIQGALKKYAGSFLAVFLSAFIFAYFHGASAIVPIFAFGLVLGFVFERTGSIVCVATMHIMNNGLTLISAKGF